MEGISQGKYHFVERWCATHYKTRGLLKFDALCKFLVDNDFAPRREREGNSGIRSAHTKSRKTTCPKSTTTKTGLNSFQLKLVDEMGFEPTTSSLRTVGKIS